MFKEVVEVIEVKDGGVEVKFNKEKMCSCCRYSFLCGPANKESLMLKTEGMEFAPGDKIEVAIDEKKGVFASFILFLFPAIIFLITLTLSGNRYPFFSFSLAILAIFLYYLVVRLILKKKEGYFKLRILRKI